MPKCKMPGGFQWGSNPLALDIVSGDTGGSPLVPSLGTVCVSKSCTSAEKKKEKREKKGKDNPFGILPAPRRIKPGLQFNRSDEAREWISLHSHSLSFHPSPTVYRVQAQAARQPLNAATIGFGTGFATGSTLRDRIRAGHPCGPVHAFRGRSSCRR